MKLSVMLSLIQLTIHHSSQVIFYTAAMKCTKLQVGLSIFELDAAIWEVKDTKFLITKEKVRVNWLKPPNCHFDYCRTCIG